MPQDATEILHTRVRFSQMVSEYRSMFTGVGRFMALMALAVVIPTGIIFFSFHLSKNSASFWDVILVLNDGAFWIFSIWTAFAILSPLLARVVAPVLIGTVELIRILLTLPQHLIDLLVRLGESSDLVPLKRNENDPPLPRGDSGGNEY